MRQDIKYFYTFFAVIMALTLSSCSDWTEDESVGLSTPTIQEQNPELYAQYLEALRVYKKTDHCVTYLSVDNCAEAPSKRNENLTNLPDSTDYICLDNPANLHPILQQQISEVRSLKGTRFLYPINYLTIENKWIDSLKAGGLDPSSEEAQTNFLVYCKEQTKQQIQYCDKYGFDGIEFVYMGRSLEGITPDALTKYSASQSAFISELEAWFIANRSKLLVMRGNPQNIVDKTFLPMCNYIILPTLDAVSYDQLSLAVHMVINSGVPKNRFLVSVSTISLDDTDKKTGYFTYLESDGLTKMSAIKGAAKWVVMPESKYTKAGIAIKNAQNDYFNISMIYNNIKEAIEIMNPTPKY